MLSDGPAAFLRAPTIGEQTYQHIRDRILAETSPNERILESALVLKLGVSRTPVREALTRLASEGYLLATPRGYQLPAITENDVENMMEMRLLLEPMAARQAAQNPGEIGFDEMESALRDERAANRSKDVDAYVAANAAFRSFWLMRVRNRLLLETLSRTMRSYRLIRRRILADAKIRRLSFETHQALLAAFRAHDAAGAAAIQEQAIDHTAAMLKTAALELTIPESGAAV